MNRLTPKQCQKIVMLRRGDDPVTITNLAFRFGVSERTVYYVLAQYKEAQAAFVKSLELAQ